MQDTEAVPGKRVAGWHDPMRALVAIDGSRAAGVAVDLVEGIDWPRGSVIRVVEALETETGPVGRLREASRDAPAHRSVAEPGPVDEAVAQLAREGIDVRGKVVCGRPATAINEAASAMGADLIVLGSRGHGTIESMLLGSVCAEVVDHASVPVLVARGWRVDRVLLAWDGSEHALVAADVLRRWPIFAQSMIRVLGVLEVGTPWWTGFPEPGAAESLPMYMDASDAMREDHDRQVAEMVAELRDAGLHAFAERREGDVAAQILAAATSSATDLIVLGTHGRTGLARLLLGSVARNVLLHAPCSVLIAPSRMRRD